MKIEKVEIHDFMSFADTVFEMKKRQDNMILITGNNIDSHVATSNGAGKTSLYDAIHWCLWGVTRRGTRGKDVMRRYSDSNKTTVKIIAETMVVERSIRQSKSSVVTTLRLFVKSKDGDLIEVTQPSIQKTNDRLVELLNGIDAQTFAKLTYFGQNDAVPITRYKDSEVKDLLQKAMGVEFLATYRVQLKEYMHPLELDILESETKTREAKHKIDYVKKLMEDYKTRLDWAETEYQNKRNKLYDNVLKISGQLDALQEEKLPSLKEVQTARLAMEELEATLKEYKIKNNGDDEIALEAHVEEKGIVQSKLEHYQDKMKSVKMKLRDLADLVGTICKECGKPYEDKDISARRKILGDNYDKCEKLIDHYESKLNEIKRDIATTKGAITKRNNNISVISDKIEALRKYVTDGENAVEMLHLKRTNLLEKLENAKQEHSNAISEAPKIKELMKRAMDDLDRYVLEEKTLSRSTNDLRSKCEIINMLIEILSDRGLKSYLFDTIVPEVNKHVAKCLSKFGDIAVTIDMQKELKSGEMVDKFDVIINNIQGGESYLSLSGGERQRVNLAMSLGFNRVLSEIIGCHFNFIFLDEVAESLDAASAESIYELIKEFVSEVENVFVITHDDSMSDLFSNHIIVTKNGNETIITEA